MSQPRALQVVALGARTPLGLRAESAAAAVRAGISRLEEQAYLIGDQDESLVGAHDPLLGDSVPFLERLEVMALNALAQVLRRLVDARGVLPQVRILLSTAEPRPGLSEADLAALHAALQGRTASWGAQLGWERAERGHAGPCASLAHALDSRDDERTLWLVGGVDSYYAPATLHAFAAAQRLQTPGTRAGFPPGEGAGFVALASPRLAADRGWASLAQLHGAHAASEPARVLEGEVTRASGLSEALLGACRGLDLPGEAPELAIGDINGERHRAEEWGLAQLRLGGALGSLDYDTPVSHWGDVGAASIPLFSALACRAFARAECTARRALLWASSDGGRRGASVLAQSRRGG